MRSDLVKGSKKRRGPYRIGQRTQLALEALCGGQAETVAQAAAVAGLTSRALYIALKKDHVRVWLRERVAAMFGAGQVLAARKMFDLLKSDNSMTAFRASQFILGTNGIAPVQERAPLVNVNIGTPAGYVINLGSHLSDRQTAGQVVDLRDDELESST